jgi:tripartite ATP-independent transporter DctM subunit
MSVLTVVLIFLLLGLIALKVPIGFSMAVTGFFYFTMHGISLETLVQKALSGANSFEMTAIPLFVLAGDLMSGGGISKRLIAIGNAFVGHITGGTGLATVIACMVFGGASGSVMAEVCAIGPIVLPAMKNEGYKPEFAAAIVGVSSELGPIIPPSITMVICASLAQVSVGKMLLSGLIPGIMIGLGLMVVIFLISKKRGYPNVKKPRASFKELLLALRNGIWALLIPVVLIGGMLAGVFTPTEASAIAVLYAIIVGFFIYKELKIKEFLTACYKAAVQTSAIMIVIGFANLYTYMLTREQIGTFAATVLSGFLHSPEIVLLIIVAISIPMGMLLSTNPSLMLLVPILVPLAHQLGCDPVWFFSIVTIATLVGTLTPPVATSLYVCSSIAGTKPEKTFVAMVPLLAVIYTVLLVGIFVPGVLIWIPNMAY